MLPAWTRRTLWKGKTEKHIIPRNERKRLVRLKQREEEGLTGHKAATPAGSQPRVSTSQTFHSKSPVQLLKGSKQGGQVHDHTCNHFF